MINVRTLWNKYEHYLMLWLYSVALLWVRNYTSCHWDRGWCVSTRSHSWIFCTPLGFIFSWFLSKGGSIMKSLRVESGTPSFKHISYLLHWVSFLSVKWGHKTIFFRDSFWRVNELVCTMYVEEWEHISGQLMIRMTTWGWWWWWWWVKDGDPFTYMWHILVSW